MNQYKPFAITAKTLGHPRKLYTPISIINLENRDKLAGITVNAMWDTGAETCVMSRRVATLLGFNFDKTIVSKGLTGECLASYGYVCVSIVNNGDCIDTIAGIVDETSPTGEYSFIIGMDFIRKGALAISTTQFETTLSFRIPVGEPIDFVSDQGKEAVAEYLPLSSTKEEIKPIYGIDVVKLFAPRKK